MSFDWNFYSDEEDLEEWTKREGFLSKNDEEGDVGVEEAVVTPSPFATRVHPAESRASVESSSESEEEVDWEDADDEEDRKPAAASRDDTTRLRPVNIDLFQKEKVPKKEKKRKRRNKFRVESLPYFLQELLWNLHRSHLLALTSRAVFVSQSCSDDTVLAVAYSLIPTQLGLVETPTLSQLRKFLLWYFDLVHGVEERRHQRRQANVAAGAPDARRRGSRRGRHGRNGKQQHQPSPSSTNGTGTSSTEELLAYMAYLSATNDEDPQLADDFVANDQLKVEVLIAMARSLGWRARFVQAIDPLTPDLDLEHPLLAGLGNIFSSLLMKPAAKKRKALKATTETSIHTSDEMNDVTSGKVMGWVEILCSDKKAKGKLRWVHVDPIHWIVNQPDQVEILLRSVQQTANMKFKRSAKRDTLAYAVAIEHCILRNSSGQEVTRYRLTDVTARYAHSFVESLKKRRLARTKKCSIEESLRTSWWSKSLHKINDSQKAALNVNETTAIKIGATELEAIVLDDSDDEKKPAAVESEPNDHTDDLEDHESDELRKSACIEAIPSNKAAFKTHPIYVIPSELGKAEVLAPDASKRICGVFKGQLVYKRTDVSIALTANKWLYEGRRVLDSEMSNPIKRVKARKKHTKAGFKALRSYGVGDTNDGSEERRSRDIAEASKALEDGMEDLYAMWQTEAWSPAPVGPNDDIPVNEYKNVELALLNPGLVHVDQQGLAKVAKKLGIPYAPCLLGFEGHGGNRTPTVLGIVVHEHNEQLVREAGAEVSNHAIERGLHDRRKSIHLRWKRLMVGLLTKARLDREYGEQES